MPPNRIANDGTRQYIRTNQLAPRFRIVTLDLSEEKPELVGFIPEDPEALLVSVTPIALNKWLVVRARNVMDELVIFEGGSDTASSQTVRETGRIAKDFVGKISVFSKRDGYTAFMSLTGFTTPLMIGKYVFPKIAPSSAAPARNGAEWSIWRRTPIEGIVPEEFIAEQIWYNSKDGTRIPMFIVRHRNTKLDGTAGVIQYGKSAYVLLIVAYLFGTGYGGFSSQSSRPKFSAIMLTVLKTYACIYALPSIRGGGEFGEAWHLAGIREKKVRSFT